MAKAGKKAGAGGQTSSRSGAGRAPSAGRKAAPRPRGSKAGAPDRGPVAVEAVVVEPVAGAGRAEADELSRSLRQALAELKALREEVRAARAEAAEARTAYRSALSEALDGVRRLRSETGPRRPQAPAVQEPADDTDEEEDWREEPEAEGEPEPPRKNRFGVTVAPGVVVAEVLTDSPAAAAGIGRGDVIEEANGRPVHSGSDLRDVVEEVPAGEDVTLHLRRAGEVLTRTVRLGAKAETEDEEQGEGNGEAKSRFGVTVAPGVVVAEVFDDSPAAAAGLARGDVIEEVAGEPITSGDELLEVIHAQPEGAEVALVVNRAGQRREPVARLDDA